MTTGKKIAIGMGCGLPLVCCLGGIVVVQGTFGSTARGLDAQVRAARKEGIPVTPGELDAMLATKPEDNAAPIYRSAMALMDADKAFDRELSAISLASARSKVKPEDRKKAIDGFHLMDPIILKLFEASKKPRCVWERDWGKGANVLFPEDAKMKGFARILAFRAQLQDERGDWKGALESLRAGQVVARHCGDDPNLIGMLVNISGETIVFNTLDKVVAKESKTPDFVNAAQKVLDGFGPLPNFKKALYGEVVMGRAAIRQLKSVSELTGTSPDGEGKRSNSYEDAIFNSPLVKDAFEAKFMEAYREMIRGTSASGADWEEISEHLTATGRKIEADHSAVNVMNRIIMPVFSQAAQAIGMLQTHRRLTGTTLRLLQERERTGHYPAVLPNYGELSIDPFSGERLHYRLEGTGFRLYSVGRDRTDDDGKPLEPGQSDKNHDEVIVIR